MPSELLDIPIEATCLQCGYALRELALERVRHEEREIRAIAFGLARFTGQFQTVADHVGKFLNLGILIVVREQNGAAVSLEIENFFREGYGRGNHNRERACVFMVSTSLNKGVRRIF